MIEPFKITILASGPKGCGKTRAINLLIKSIVESKDFEWIDGRFIELSKIEEEEQQIELKLK